MGTLRANPIHMHKYRNLNVWNEGRGLVKDIYLWTAKFPKDERFGLVSQMRRASISIISNIAEGAGRRTNAEYKQFLGYAHGSVFELEAQCFVAVDLGFMDEALLPNIADRVDHISRMLIKLKDSLKP